MPFDKDTLLLFTLLRDALWHTDESIPLILAENECRQLLSSAEKQAVTGLIVDALIRRQVKLPQMTVFEIIGTLEQIKNQNRVVNQGVFNLHKLMEDASINYSVMKGQVLAAYYPDALLRQSGDIDYYCSPQDFERSLDVVKDKWGVQPEIHGSEKHADYEYQGNRYEPHYILTDLHSKKANDYLKRLIDADEGVEVEIGGVMVRTLSPTLHTLYLFLHLYFHLVEVGVGLRQFCDLAVMLYEGVDHSELKKHMKALGMVRAFRACEYIMTDCLGLKEECLPYEIRTVDRKYGKRILEVVLYRGNMGHYNKRNGWSGLGHKVESACIKISHVVKFWRLSPAYFAGMVKHRMFKNVTTQPPWSE